MVKSDANIGYFISFVSVYLIIKYTENRHNAKLGVSPYINVASIGKDIKVNINVNNKTLLVLYFFDSCLHILYNANTISKLHIILKPLNIINWSKCIILNKTLKTNAREIC